MALTQHDIDQEMAAEREAYEKRLAGGAPVEHHPRRDYAPYRSSVLRHPRQPAIAIDVTKDPEMVELSSPPSANAISPRSTTTSPGSTPGAHRRAHHRLGPGPRPRGTPGARAARGDLAGQLGRPLRPSARAARRPLDPNFTGTGRTLTDGEGRYRFTTIQPGPYPWRNHENAWRPAHIHFSLFGSAFTQRLVTQMYFPNDPLFPHDPILHSVTDPAARQRLIATYEHGLSVPEFSLGYHWDIVLDGPHATWFEEGR